MRTTIANLTLLATLTAAQSTMLDTLSFGQTIPISKDGTTIPSFTLLGHDPSPQIFSDRIQLTPPHPGNKRGALWATTPLTSPTWDLNLEFRASGPERGSGNLQLWLLKDKSPATDLASVYTVDKFDGLGLVLDQYGGQGGSLRGFLNDGTTSYRQRTDIDSLAFGHCSYAYRNLGRMSRLRVSQSQTGFEVAMDDKLCFRSEKMVLPGGYYFGVSAASAEHPDAFEVAKFVVSAGTGGAGQLQQHEVKRDTGTAPSVQFQQHQQQMGGAAAGGQVQESMAQFFTQMQALNQKIDSLVGQVQAMDGKVASRHEELRNGIPRIPADTINAIAGRLEQVEREVKVIRKEVEGKDYKDNLQRLHDTMESLNGGFSESMTASEYSHL